MARYGLFMLKVPLNPNQPTNQPTNQIAVVQSWPLRPAKLQSDHHHPNTSTQILYRPDSLSVTKRPVSKQWRQIVMLIWHREKVTSSDELLGWGPTTASQKDNHRRPPWTREPTDLLRLRNRHFHHCLIFTIQHRAWLEACMPMHCPAVTN